jgi:hypothetical protein
VRNGIETLVITCHHGGMDRNNEEDFPEKATPGQAIIFMHSSCR